MSILLVKYIAEGGTFLWSWGRCGNSMTKAAQSAGGGEQDR